MNRRLLALLIIICVLLVGGIGAYFAVFPLGTSFHYERKISEPDNGTFTLGIDNIKDCELNISFVNNPQLLYTIDIAMYEFSSSSSFYLYNWEGSSRMEFNYYMRPGRTDWSGEPTRIKSMDIVLGTGKAYNIYIAGTNLTAHVNYSNGALIASHGYFRYIAPNSRISFAYDGYTVDDSTLESYENPVRLDIDLGSEDSAGQRLQSVTLEVDLPYLYFGDADLLTESLSITMGGWVQGALTSSFYTEDVEGNPPEFFIDVYSEEITANLVKAVS